MEETEEEIVEGGRGWLVGELEGRKLSPTQNSARWSADVDAAASHSEDLGKIIVESKYTKLQILNADGLSSSNTKNMPPGTFIVRGAKSRPSSWSQYSLTILKTRKKKTHKI